MQSEQTSSLLKNPYVVISNLNGVGYSIAFAGSYDECIAFMQIHRLETTSGEMELRRTKINPAGQSVAGKRVELPMEVFQPAHITNPNKAVEFCQIAKCPQPALEPLLASTDYTAYWYAVNILKGPFRAGEDAIAKDAQLSLHYAINILKDRFIAGESAIGKSTHAMTYFRRFKDKFPNKRFMMGEHNGYLNSPEDIVAYALVSNARFLEGEKILLKLAKEDPANIKHLIAYIAVTDHDDERFEAVIASDAQSSYDYAYSRKERFIAGESTIAKSTPELALLYATEIIKGPFIIAEKLISKDANAAYYYALEVLKLPFPEAEGVIARSPHMALLYAKDVLKDTFPEGEKYIAKDATTAFLYAQQVVKGKFKLGERVILANQKFTHQYSRLIHKNQSLRFATLCPQCFAVNVVPITCRVCKCAKCIYEFDIDNPKASTRKVRVTSGKQD